MGAGIEPQLDKADGRQLPDRFAHQGSGHAEFFGHCLFLQTRAGGQATVQNVGAGRFG